MDESIYKVIELVGTSPRSWEEAVQNIVNTASKSLRDMRIAEVKELDVRLENGKIVMAGTGKALLDDPHIKKAYLAM